MSCGRNKISIATDSTEDMYAIESAHHVADHLKMEGRQNVQIENNTGYVIDIYYD